MNESERLAFSRLLSFLVASIVAGLITVGIALLSARVPRPVIEIVKVVIGMTVGAGLANLVYSELVDDRKQISQVKIGVGLFVVVMTVLCVGKVILTLANVTFQIDQQQAMLVMWVLLPVARLFVSIRTYLTSGVSSFD
jgi:hypothetical protein